jgi:NAD(P)-dependent dehydrogenase (short-subunit alcohol dehydrogenase family)
LKRDEAAVVVRTDVSTSAGRNHLLDECLRVFGKLDILVLNASIMLDFIANLHPQNRVAQPDEIAPISFLASPAANWVNGQNTLVNGVRSLLVLIIGLC